MSLRSLEVGSYDEGRGLEVRRQVREWLTELYRICEHEAPEQWTRSVYRKLTAPLPVERTHPPYQEARIEAARHIRAYADFLRELIGEQHRATSLEGGARDPRETVLHITDVLVHHVAEKLAIPEPLELREDEKPCFLSWERLCALPGVEFLKEGERSYVEVAGGRGVARIPIPDISEVMHKGGAARIFLKLIAGAEEGLLEAEIPLNDVDVVVSGEDLEHLKREAAFLGADPEGIEQVPSFRKMRELFTMRDIDLNQCFLGKDGLHYSERALKAAQTGIIEISSRARSLYGSETFRHDGRLLLKARGLMRLLKFTAEGKAHSFSVTELNTYIPLGIYWLFLTRKFAKKHQFPELAQKLHYLGNQVQHQKMDEPFINVLDRVHEQFPFFEMEGGNLNEVDVMRWLIKKAIRVTDKHFQATANVPVKPFLPEDPALDQRIDISLDGFAPDGAVQGGFIDEWPAFLDRCRERNRAFADRRLPKPLFIEDDS